MADFSIYFPIENSLEGVEYQNPENDQCNKFGLEVSDLTLYYKKACTCTDVENLVSGEAFKILKALYWDFFQADSINNQALAMFIVDSGLVHGSVFIAEAVQNFCKVTVDGAVGPKTLAAINSMIPFELYCKLYGYRQRKYEGLENYNPSKEEYNTGWENRLDAIKVSA